MGSSGAVSTAREDRGQDAPLPKVDREKLRGWHACWSSADQPIERASYRVWNRGAKTPRLDVQDRTLERGVPVAVWGVSQFEDRFLQLDASQRYLRILQVSTSHAGRVEDIVERSVLVRDISQCFGGVEAFMWCKGRGIGDIGFKPPGTPRFRPECDLDHCGVQ